MQPSIYVLLCPIYVLSMPRGFQGDQTDASHLEWSMGLYLVRDGASESGSIYALLYLASLPDEFDDRLSKYPQRPLKSDALEQALGMPTIDGLQ